MATYKVLQDIEAEDHIIGPLTLRQFIYGLVAALFYYICFILISKHASILLVLFLPVALLATFFAFPFKRDQPTEVWALAKLKFLVKPRSRIWSQSGIKEWVTVTARKKVEHNLTKGLSQTEVKNRLEALALTIDSRGWVIKNVVGTPNTYDDEDSDRLITPGSIPRPVPDEGFFSEDMLDDSSPESMHAQELLAQSGQKRRMRLVQSMEDIRAQQQAVLPPVVNTSIPNQDESAISKELKARSDLRNLATSSMQTVPDGSAAPSINSHQDPQAVKKTAPEPHLDPNVLNFALSNSGNLSIQTQAEEAKKASASGEVVVKLR